jgi:predicted porin
MNKTLIVAAISALAAGGALAQSSYSIYGLIDASYGKAIVDDSLKIKSDFHSGGDDGSGQGNSTTRVGLKGSSDVGSGIKANFKFETGGITSNGEVNPGGYFFNRAAWAGLSGAFGEVRLGRQDSVPFQTGIDFDLNGASNGISSGGYANAAPWLRGRQSRSLQYISPTVGGVKAQIGFVPKGNVAGAKDTLSAAVTYSTGPLSLAATAESKRTTTGTNFAAIMGSYDFKVVKLTASYADGGKDAKGVNLGISAPVAGYTFGALYAKNSDTKGSAYELFVNKEVLKNTYAYAEVGGADKKAMTALGLPNKGTGYAVGVIFVF